MSDSDIIADVAHRRYTSGTNLHLQLLVLFTVLFCLVASNGFAAQKADEARTGKIEAACLYHLTHMLTWPESLSSKQASPLRIAFVGNDSRGMVASLRELLNSQQEHLQTVELLEFEQDAHAVPATAETLSSFHLVFFLGNSSSGRYELLKTLAAEGVVSVGENNLFLDTGGAIAFVIKRKRIRIYVDRLRLESAGVTASAEFLQHVVFVKRRERS